MLTKGLAWHLLLAQPICNYPRSLNDHLHCMQISACEGSASDSFYHYALMTEPRIPFDMRKGFACTVVIYVVQVHRCRRHVSHESHQFLAYASQHAHPMSITVIIITVGLRATCVSACLHVISVMLHASPSCIIVLSTRPGICMVRNAFTAALALANITQKVVRYVHYA